MRKRFIPPLSNCRICMDQSLTGFYTVGQKLSDVIPVLRITPRATEPSTVSVFLSSVKCGRICMAQTCAHSGIEPSTLAKGFLQGRPKVRKNFEFFTISRLYVHISQKLLKIEAYKQCMRKRFIPPLSNCRICMDQSLTGFHRVGQTLSDVIPVLRLTPIGTQPSAVSVFLSVAK